MATKARKQEIVSELSEFFNNGKVVIVSDVSGLTVKELTQLRRKLDKDNAKCRIGKNTLIKIATNSKEFEAIKELAKGPSAVIVGYDDPAQPAKTAIDFFKALKKGSVRGGVLEGRKIGADEVKGLAELPSKDQLLSSIMGGLDSGARNIAGILESIIRDIALLAEEVAKKNCESAQPTEEAAKPTEEAAKPTEEAAKPAEETAKPTEEAAKPIEEAAKPTEEAAKPAEETAKPTEEAEKPTEEAAKSNEEAAQPTEEAAKTNEDTAKTTEDGAA